MASVYQAEAVEIKGIVRVPALSKALEPRRSPLTGGKSREREAWIRALFTVLGFSSVIIMALIVLFLFQEGIGLFATVSISDFLFGQFWYPTYDPADFGILPLIMGSLAVTFISSAIAVPLGVGAALYLAEVASSRVREIIKPAVELLASLPSVVLGFVGMVVIAPLMQELLDIPTGLNVLNASLMLAIMAIPTITSLSEDALHSVPTDLKEASLALGATRWETLTRVQIPGAISGMGTGVILGMSRARMAQVMKLLTLAPPIQEKILLGEIVVHELGHTFGCLADEYEDSIIASMRKSQRQVPELPYPNVQKASTLDLKDMATTLKWKDLYNDPLTGPHTGAFEGGCYTPSGVYRPAETCCMREATGPFCPVCALEIYRALCRRTRREEDWEAFTAHYA